MKRSVLLSLIVIPIIMITADLLSLEVDVEELKSAKKVKFTNYRGPHRNRDTINEVRAIGRELTEAVKRTGDNKQARYHRKYSIIRAITEKEPEKLNADIFLIDEDARVTHVKYVQHMVAGYLHHMYGYSWADADTLALFAVYYNALFRGDIKYFSAKYKTHVMEFVNEKNAGISTHYRDWPGTTRMLIPLTEDAARGKIDSIDPDILTDDRVRDEVRKDDENIPERKKMVDLMERKAEKEKEKVEKEKEDLEKERERLREEEKKREEEKERIREEEERLKQEKEEARGIADPEKRKEKQEEIKKKEEELEEKKEEIKEEEKEQPEKEKELQEKEKEIEKKEEEVKRQEEKIEDEKKKIEKDEIKRDIKTDQDKAEERLEKKAEELEKKEKEIEELEEEIKKTDADKAIVGDKLYYLKINEWIKNGHYNNELFMINAATMKVIKKSPVTNIGGRKYIAYSKGIVVITHPGDFANENHLTMVDTETLEEITTGKDNVFWRSFVEIQGGHIFAVMIVNGKYYLGKFDEQMNLVVRSQEEVHKDTFISFFKDKIYINGSDKKIMVLKKDDLSLIDRIQP